MIKIMAKNAFSLYVNIYGYVHPIKVKISCMNTSALSNNSVTNKKNFSFLNQNVCCGFF